MMRTQHCYYNSIEFSITRRHIKVGLICLTILHLLSSLFRLSQDISKRKRPSWWNQNIPLGNIKSGYSEETLVQLLTDYRNFNPDEPAVALKVTDLSVCERSPRRQVSSNQQTESVFNLGAKLA